MTQKVKTGIMPLLVFALVLTAAPSLGADEGDEFLGTWNLTMETPQGSREMKLVVGRDDAGALTAAIESRMGRGGGEGATRTTEATDVKVQEGELSFNITRRTQRGEMSMDYAFTLDGEDLAGSLSMPFGEMELSGKRADT